MGALCCERRGSPCNGSLCLAESYQALEAACMDCAGLAEAGRMGTKERVLVTAAAGGTGQFVVQLAKAAGNTVIATCGSDDKAAMLQRLGADRVINYRTEDVGRVLRAEYPQVQRWLNVPCEVALCRLTACARLKAQ